MTIPPGPLYRPEVGPRLLKAARSNPTWEGIPVWGGTDINGPGGAGIYPYLGYWIDSPIGRYVAMRMLAGFWNRWQGLGPYKAVDDAHLGRVSHVVNWLAPTESFARTFQTAIHRRLSGRWYNQGTGTNMMLWGIHDILDRYPAHIGSSELGRPFAHALIFAVEFGAQTGAWQLAHDLIKAAQHCQDAESGAVYMIRPMNPAFPQIADNAYSKKINAKSESINKPGLNPAEIAAAGSPAFYIPFEEQLTLYGVSRYCEYFGGAEALRDGMMKMGAFPKEVRFPTHPELDHPKATLWGHALEPFKDRGTLDAIHEITHNPIGDGAGGAIHPSLYPA